MCLPLSMVIPSILSIPSLGLWNTVMVYISIRYFEKFIVLLYLDHSPSQNKKPNSYVFQL